MSTRLGNHPNTAHPTGTAHPAGHLQINSLDACTWHHSTGDRGHRGEKLFILRKKNCIIRYFRGQKDIQTLREKIHSNVNWPCIYFPLLKPKHKET